MFRKFITFFVFLLFLAMIPLANYTLMHFGTKCLINGPCTLLVWPKPELHAPSGVLFVGFAFVLRDILQRLAGLKISILAVVIGAGLSYIFVNPTFAFATCLAYFLSEFSDTYVYTKLQRYNLIMAVLVSACIGIFIDSIVFLHFAFHNFDYLAGQIIGKIWMVLISIPLIILSRHLIKT